MRLITALLAILLLALPGPAMAASTLRQQTLRLDTDSGTLYGTLLYPPTATPPPVALLIAGSGPTNRDGNNSWARNNSLKLLAQSLGQRGIATLRYDKRGVEASYEAGPDERRFSVGRFTLDAVEWSRQLLASGRFSRLVLIGHSEGALIASLAAREAGAAAVISIAGSGRPIDQLLLEQLQQRPLPPLLQGYSQWLIQELDAGRPHSNVPPALMDLFRPSVQPYLISLFHQDPARAFAALQVPTLIIQGRNDIQVSEQDALALKQARPEARLRLIEGMNHVLRIVPPDLAQQRASYANPNLPIAWELPQIIADFIKNLPQK